MKAKLKTGPREQAASRDPVEVRWIRECSARHRPGNHSRVHMVPCPQPCRKRFPGRGADRSTVRSTNPGFTGGRSDSTTHTRGARHAVSKPAGVCVHTTAPHRVGEDFLGPEMQSLTRDMGQPYNGVGWEHSYVPRRGTPVCSGAPRDTAWSALPPAGRGGPPGYRRIASGHCPRHPYWAPTAIPGWDAKLKRGQPGPNGEAGVPRGRVRLTIGSRDLGQEMGVYDPSLPKRRPGKGGYSSG